MEKSTDQVIETLSKFSDSVGKIEEKVSTLLKALKALRTAGSSDGHETNSLSKTDSLSRARLHITLAYAVNSLFCMYLKTQGITPSSHPVSAELARVQDAFLRLRKVEAGQSTIHVSAPKRNIRENIAKLKLAQKELAMLVFPEENQLFNALNNIDEGSDGLNKSFLDEDDDCRSGDGKGNPAGAVESELENQVQVAENGDGKDLDDRRIVDEDVSQQNKRKKKEKSRKVSKHKNTAKDFPVSSLPAKRKAEADLEAKSPESPGSVNEKRRKKKKKHKKDKTDNE